MIEHTFSHHEPDQGPNFELTSIRRGFRGPSEHTQAEFSSNKPITKGRLTLALILLASLCVCYMTIVQRAHASDRTNFIIFIADDVSAVDLGCYGNQVISTPHVDRLASEGMVFTNAYLTISSCSPSRASILTGRYPHNTGASELHRLLPEEQVRFPRLLKDEGYYTVLSGKVHGITEDDTAFDVITDGGWPEHPGASEDWVKLVESRPKDKPFLFWFASIDAHRGWQFSGNIQRYAPEDVVVPPYMKDDQKTREDLAAYYHEISRFDDYIGQVIAELEAQGVYDNTMIVVMADNGRPFLGAKARLYDSGIKTPFVVRAPGRVAPPQRSASLVSSIDLAPSILEIAGIQPPEEIQGVSFVPILSNPESVTREVAFAESNWHVYKSYRRLVRYGNIAYIRDNYPTHHTGGILTSLHDRATGELRDNDMNAPVEQLFDVELDPDQLVNQAGNAVYRSELNRARRLLEAWTEQTGDSIPSRPTPDRDPESEIRNPHREQPGDSTNATAINHPGPVRLTDRYYADQPGELKPGD